MYDENAWHDLPDIGAVAKARDAQWEIECQHPSNGSPWYEWDGKFWNTDFHYRGRPPAKPRRVVRVREALCGGMIVPMTQEQYDSSLSLRLGIGWVKGAEWVEKEVEND